MKTPPHSLVQMAQKLATEAHAGQFRRSSTVPFIEHPKAVVNRVGDDLDAQAVAWLHDVIEDSDHTADTLLQAGIPAHLVDAVVLLTKESEEDYDDYLERVASSPLATKVKIADLISNLADHPTEAQIRKYSKGLARLTCGGPTKAAMTNSPNPKTLVRHEGHTPRERSACGWRDRLISREDQELAPAAWAHAVDIDGAKPHYHKVATELYYVLDGGGHVILDGVEHEVRKGSLVHIPSGVVHSAVGRMRVLVVGIPDIAEGDYYAADAPPT